MHESEQRRRLSPPAAQAAPPASPRPFPQPDPSPQSPSSVTSLCRVLACKVAAPPFLERSDPEGYVAYALDVSGIQKVPASVGNVHPEWEGATGKSSQIR